MLRLSDLSRGLLVKLDNVIRFVEDCLVVDELVECRLGGATTRRSLDLCLNSKAEFRFLLFYKRAN